MKLYNDDCMNILKEMENNSVDLIVTDPPYLIEQINGGGSVNNIKKLNSSLKDLETSNLLKGYDIREFGEEFLRVTKNPNIYIWCNKKQIPEYIDFYVREKKLIFEIICWHKTNALPTYSNKYLSDTEYCLYFKKGGVCNPTSYESAKTYFVEPINHKDKKLYKHPTIKPLNMIERFINNSSNEGQIVLDPFMGSGTTGVACKKLNRNFIGVELDAEYFETAKKRIENE